MSQIDKIIYIPLIIWFIILFVSLYLFILYLFLGKFLYLFRARKTLIKSLLVEYYFVFFVLSHFNYLTGAFYSFFFFKGFNLISNVLLHLNILQYSIKSYKKKIYIL